MISITPSGCRVPKRGRSIILLTTATPYLISTPTAITRHSVTAIYRALKLTITKDRQVTLNKQIVKLALVLNTMPVVIKIRYKTVFKIG